MLDTALLGMGRLGDASGVEGDYTWQIPPPVQAVKPRTIFVRSWALGLGQDVITISELSIFRFPFIKIILSLERDKIDISFRISSSSEKSFEKTNG